MHLHLMDACIDIFTLEIIMVVWILGTGQLRFQCIDVFIDVVSKPLLYLGGFSVESKYYSQFIQWLQMLRSWELGG